MNHQRRKCRAPRKWNDPIIHALYHDSFSLNLYALSSFISSSGAANLRLTVPDTITQWKASGFCMNDKAGFGLSPTVSMTAFQPFFVDLTLPYSVVRGEAFTLKANVFNYLKSCIQVPALLSKIASSSLCKLSSNISCLMIRTW